MSEPSTFALPVLADAAQSCKVLANAVRDDTLTVDLAENLHHAWVVAGYGLSFFDKHPPMVGGTNAAAEQAASALDLLAEALTAADVKGLSAEEQKAFPWAIVVPYLIDFIAKFFIKK